jgi:hypothetical protein
MSLTSFFLYGEGAELHHDLEVAHLRSAGDRFSVALAVIVAPGDELL